MATDWRTTAIAVGMAVDGVAWLAVRSGAKVVPVACLGTAVALPKGAKFPKRTPVRVVEAIFAHRADPSYATALARLAEAPVGPTPIGVLRDVKRPVYGRGPATEPPSEAQLADLLTAGETWTIS